MATQGDRARIVIRRIANKGTTCRQFTKGLRNVHIIGVLEMYEDTKREMLAKPERLINDLSAPDREKLATMIVEYWDTVAAEFGIVPNEILMELPI